MLSDVGELQLGFEQDERDQDTPKRGDPCNQEAHVVPSSDEHGVDRVPGCTGEVVSLEQAIALGVADDRLDRVPSSQFAPDGR